MNRPTVAAASRIRGVTRSSKHVKMPRRQGAAVAAAYLGQSFVLAAHHDIGEWRTLVLLRAGAAG